MIEAEAQALIDLYVAAYRVGDAEGCAALFTADAELYSPFGPPARGRQAIAETHAEWTSEGAGTGAKTMTVLSAGRSGDMAWCLVGFAEGAAGGGVSLNVLHRQGDGWRIRMCSLNETPG
ncbi:YybH family protein [Maliponia aquimaris]|uniref:SnoaL-like domain protein n=1 Tax=Maliponia aquimaris TaxID=1673631 RepID=A0A238K660_9RHOB|nr:DUF4440 domain-containing protein [Maliponia aquimaris]SMX38400.1 SnoaL-like domain protein [Maliponia aquimaris]